MKKRALVELLFLATIFSLPLYLVRFKIFFFPTNVLEILALCSIVSFIIYRGGKIFSEWFSSLGKFLFPISILLLATILSIAYDDNFSLAGLGILKGWFLIPILFAISAASLFKNEFGSYRILWSMYLSMLVVSLISLAYKIFGIVTYDGRLSSFYDSPNQLSMYIVFAIFIFPILVSSPEEWVLRWKKILLLSILPIIACLFWTFSYSVWISILAPLVAILVLGKDFSGRSFILLAITSIIAIFLLVQFYSPKFKDVFDSRSSFSSRIIIWKSSILMIEDNPIFGIGPGNFQKKYLQYQQYFPPYLEWAVPHPHNLYMSFWLQTGIMGLASFVYICILSLNKAIRKRKNAYFTAFLGIMLYILIHGSVDSTFWKNDLSYIFWVLIFPFQDPFPSSRKDQDDIASRPSCL